MLALVIIAAIVYIAVFGFHVFVYGGTFPYQSGLDKLRRYATLYRVMDDSAAGLTLASGLLWPVTYPVAAARVLSHALFVKLNERYNAWYEERA